MKNFLYTVCILLSLPFSMSGQTTDDHVTIGEATLFPGGDVCGISVSLPNATQYTAIGIDIFIPEGCEFVKQKCLDADEEEVMAYAERGSACKASHIVDSEIQSDGALRVAVYSNVFFRSSGNIFTFFVKASIFSKPGLIPVEIKKCSFTGTDGNKYKSNDITIGDKVTISSSAQSPLTIKSENKWSTLILPFNSSVPTGVTAYTCDSKDEAGSVLNLTKVTSLKAFTPYILYSENGYEGTLAGTVAAEAYPASGVVSAGLLKGAITQQVATSGEYVLANQNNETRFYKVTEGKTKTIPAGKCWASFPSASAKESFGLHFNPTSIKNVEANGNKSGKVYSIDGKQIKNGNPRGLYIANGRKMIGK